MASISTDSNGLRRIQFTRPGDGKRSAIYCGDVTMKQAETIRSRVEILVNAAMSKTPVDEETSKWLSSIGDRLHRSISKHGLVPGRQRRRLEEFIDWYVSSRRDVSKGTTTNYGIVKARLLAFFEPDQLLHEITEGNADAWMIFLRSKGNDYAPATIGKTLKTVRQFFRAAVRGRFITSNPFEGIKAPRETNSSRKFNISHSVIQRVIAAAPDADWRLIIALSRYGGLRCPSEHATLTWPDVDWTRGMIRIVAPKKEHLEDGGERWIPIFPELRPYLLESFEFRDLSEPRVITRHVDAKTNLRTRFIRILRSAGVKQWPRLFQNLRASRETELAEQFPLHVVCMWLGNSEKVASEHYLQVTDEHYRRGTTHKTAQYDAVFASTAEQGSNGICEKHDELQVGTDVYGFVPEGVLTPTGLIQNDASILSIHKLIQDLIFNRFESDALSPMPHADLLRTHANAIGQEDID